MRKITKSFSYDEMVFSQTALRKGIRNEPDATQMENLLRLCNLLEDARTLLGCPLHVDSGFRSQILNAAVGGSPISAHMDGRAADVIPMYSGNPATVGGFSPLEWSFKLLRSSPLQIDQIIIECGAWLHIGIAPIGRAPRHEALIASGEPGNWTYRPAVG